MKIKTGKSLDWMIFTQQCGEDGYLATIREFAELWAEEMEPSMRDTHTVGRMWMDLAPQTFDELNKEYDLTEDMESAIRETLIRFWRYGDNFK